MPRPDCDNHVPQRKGFPWEDPGGFATWCPTCGALEINDEHVGTAHPDPDDPLVWLFQPVIPLNWVNITVKLDQGETDV